MPHVNSKILGFGGLDLSYHQIDRGNRQAGYQNTFLVSAHVQEVATEASSFPKVSRWDESAVTGKSGTNADLFI